MIFINYNPPHFEVKYNEFKANVLIENGQILNGDMPVSKLKLIAAWVEIHREELMFNFNESQKDSQSFKKINPLI